MSNATAQHTSQVASWSGGESFLAFGDKLVLMSAFLSLLFSIALWFGIAMPVNKEAGIFVGIWVPSIIGTGIYVHVARAAVVKAREQND